MFSFENGSPANATISNGPDIATGVFNSVNKGDNVFLYKGLTEGNVILNVTVQNSDGLEKKGKINLTIRDVKFDFTARLNTPTNQIFVDNNVQINFDFTETGNSHFPYEMTYSPAVINFIQMGDDYLRNNYIEVNYYSTIPVTNGSSTTFPLYFQPLIEGENTLTFTIRNKITMKAKSYDMKFDAVTKPSVEVTWTGLEHVHHGGFSSWSDKDLNILHIGYKITKDSRRTIQSVIINFPNKGESYYLPTTNQDDASNWHDFRLNEDSDTVYGDQPYTITITDSNGVSSTTNTKNWSNSHD